MLIACSIAIQSLSVASLWRSIDRCSLPIFLTGGVLGIPAGVYLLLHRQHEDLAVVEGVDQPIREPAETAAANTLAERIPSIRKLLPTPRSE